jgi:ribose transport system permease protein
MTCIHSEFGNIGHIRVLLYNVTTVCLFALGMTFPVIAGGIDLSLPWTMNSVVILLNFFTSRNLSYFYPILILCLFGSLIVGMLNGFGIAYLKIHPMIMTFGMNSILSGLLLVITGGTSGGFTPEPLKTFIGTNLLGIPLVFLLLVFIIFFLTVILTNTSFGKCLYAIGNGEKASYLSGVNVKAVKMQTYIISSLLAFFGGIVMSGRIGQSYLGMGSSVINQTLAIVAVGGVSFQGGSGNVVGTAGGAIIIVILLSALTSFKISTGAQQAIYGVILLCSVVLSVHKKTRGASRDY